MHPSRVKTDLTAEPVGVHDFFPWAKGMRLWFPTPSKRNHRGRQSVRSSWPDRLFFPRTAKPVRCRRQRLKAVMGSRRVFDRVAIPCRRLAVTRTMTCKPFIAIGFRQLPCGTSFSGSSQIMGVCNRAGACAKAISGNPVQVSPHEHPAHLLGSLPDAGWLRHRLHRQMASVCEPAGKPSGSQELVCAARP